MSLQDGPLPLASSSTATGQSVPQTPASQVNTIFNETSNGNNNQDTTQSNSGNRMTVIILATVMSIFGCLLLAAITWAVVRCRKRSKLFTRGITPIGDDEIETWKGHRTEEGEPDRAPLHVSTEGRGHQKNDSMTSMRKPPSVIVYARKSEELSPISPTLPNYPFSKMSFDDGNISLDKDVPFSPIQARAPNAREGLTDDAIPGDEPFVGSAKRRGSRLSKVPRYSHQAHLRSKSSRSSFSLVHGVCERSYGYESDDHRPTHDFYTSHARISSQDPPLLSLSDDWLGGLTSGPFIRAEDIGRAIG